LSLFASVKTFVSIRGSLVVLQSAFLAYELLKWMILDMSAPARKFKPQPAPAVRGPNWKLRAGLISLTVCLAASLQIAAGQEKREITTQIAAAELLRGHIATQQRKVITDTNSTRILWSDGVILEVADRLPLTINSILNGTPYHTDLQRFLNGTQQQLHAEYHPARMREKSSREGYIEFESASATPKIQSFVNPVYVAYVQARYPASAVLLKGKYDPVVFTVDGQIRALILPFKLPNDNHTH
jgi:hypothetical protein